jgi:hypothetical protein
MPVPIDVIRYHFCAFNIDSALLSLDCCSQHLSTQLSRFFSKLSANYQVKDSRMTDIHWIDSIEHYKLIALILANPDIAHQL